MICHCVRCIKVEVLGSQQEIVLRNTLIVPSRTRKMSYFLGMGATRKRGTKGEGDSKSQGWVHPNGRRATLFQMDIADGRTGKSYFNLSILV